MSASILFFVLKIIMVLMYVLLLVPEPVKLAGIFFLNGL